MGKYPSVLKWTIYGPLRVLADGPLCIAHAEMLLNSGTSPSKYRTKLVNFIFLGIDGGLCVALSGLFYLQPGLEPRGSAATTRGTGHSSQNPKVLISEQNSRLHPGPAPILFFQKSTGGVPSVWIHPPTVCHSSSGERATGERKHFPPKRIF